ncbi:hypothetical protein RvY_05541 [Ramazzottius varieornatus]|uniref:Uncharacterized protein n=1 Tax=Ramazzottius varieornatus TaxID=947166 RepID=A0A1D1UYG1_RAMVA|nr:hypothetical protein RvY_05541 [Ramazzottius varieornatus]
MSRWCICKGSIESQDCRVYPPASPASPNLFCHISARKWDSLLTSNERKTIRLHPHEYPNYDDEVATPSSTTNGRRYTEVPPWWRFQRLQSVAHMVK